MTDDYEDEGLGGKFWMKAIGIIFLGGAVAMIVFVLIGWAWYTWGIIGMFLFFFLVLGGVIWIMDRRKQKQYDEERGLTSP